MDDSVTIKSVKKAISDDLNERYQETSLIALMNTALILVPWFKSLAHLNRDSIDVIIKHVEDEMLIHLLVLLNPLNPVIMVVRWLM